MMSRTWEVLQYKESRDPKVASVRIQVQTGGKWRADKALEVAHVRGRRHWWGPLPQAVQVLASSQLTEWTRPRQRAATFYSGGSAGRCVGRMSKQVGGNGPIRSMY